MSRIAAAASAVIVPLSALGAQRTRGGRRRDMPQPARTGTASSIGVVRAIT